MNLSISPPRRLSDPGAPELRFDVAAVVAAAVLLAAGVVRWEGGPWGEVAVLGAWLVVAELLVITLADGSHLPVSLGLLGPVAVVARLPAAALVVAGAAFVAACLRKPRSVGVIVRQVVARTAAALAAWAAYRGALGVVALVTNGATNGASGPAVIGALVVSGAAVLAAELIARRIQRHGSFREARGYAAFLALGASAVLIGVAIHGVDGRGAMGLWAVPVFAVPALSARWAYGRLDAIRRTYDQTVDVLSVVPEMGGRVPAGHSRRVASMATEMARHLDLPPATVLDVERAGLLHALGTVTFDEERARWGAREPAEVAAATLAVLRDEERLSRPAGLVAGMAGEAVPEADRVGTEILATAAAYENITAGDPMRSRAAFDSLVGSRELSDLVRDRGSTDRRVLLALARVVAARGHS